MHDEPHHEKPCRVTYTRGRTGLSSSDWPQELFISCHSTATNVIIATHYEGPLAVGTAAVGAAEVE